MVHLAWVIQPSRDTERQRLVNVIGRERELRTAGRRAEVHRRPTALDRLDSVCRVRPLGMNRRDPSEKPE